MAERRVPFLGHRESSKNGESSKPGSPDLGSRVGLALREDYDPGPSGSSNCSSPLLPRQQGRFSFYSHNSEKSQKSFSPDGSIKPKKKGIMKILNWFRKKDISKKSIQTSSERVNGSATSLCSSVNESYFFPLSKSRSNDNHENLGKNVKQTGTLSALQVLSSRSNPSSPISGVNAQITYINTTEIQEMSRSASADGYRKRTAPQPPGAMDYKDVAVQENSNSSRYNPSRFSISDKNNPFYSSNRSSMDSTNSFDGKASRGIDDSAIYARTKRKAPQPPETNCKNNNEQIWITSHCDKVSTLDISGISNKRTCTISSIDTSTMSQFSTLTSSTSTQSSSTLKGSITSKCSGESLRLEKGFLKQDLPNHDNNTARTEPTCHSPNPKPWYKRKKKSKSSKRTEKMDLIEQVYEFWRPEIQFSEGKISLKGNKTETPLQIRNETLMSSVSNTNKTKRKSQVSLLASISQLDKEAVEQLRKEKEDIKSAKEAYDDQFYNTRGPHMLTQTDITGSNLTKSNKIYNNSSDPNVSNNYDNLESMRQSSEDRLSYTKQSTLKLENNDNKLVQNKHIVQKTESEAIHVTQSHLQSKSSRTESHPKKFLCSSGTTSSTSLLQMANLDAEMFYQLAKDVKCSPDQRIKPNKTSQSSKFVKKGFHSSDESESDRDSSTPKQQRHNKNFGIRMNQLFTPDVSVIMEASESITSSATTPADEGMSDVNLSVSKDNSQLQNQYSYEYRFGADEAREIMQELADVREEVNRINEEEIEDQRQKKIGKAGKIKEVRLLTENNNFSAWDHMINETMSQSNLGNGTPQPIEICPQEPESKWKWVCDACTLINLPWKITCEACSSRRPSKPSRVCDDGTILVSPKIPNGPESSNNSFSDGSRLTVIDNIDFDRGSAHQRDSFLIQENDSICPADSASQIVHHTKTNWESELKKYFSKSNQTIKEQSLETHQNSHILYNNVGQESIYGKINVLNRNRQTETIQDNAIKIDSSVDEQNLELLRKARIERFEQGIKTFEAMIKGSSEKQASSCNLELRVINERPIASQIDSLIPQFDSSEKVFYKKEVRKRPLLNTRGAVKSTISIFNQKEAIDNPNSPKEKLGFNKQSRRKSIGFIREQMTLFEKMQTITTQDMKPTKYFMKNNFRSTVKEIPPEIDISSAILKFDEIAALAEVERLNPKFVRPNFSKKPPKTLIMSENKNSFNKSSTYSENYPKEKSDITDVISTITEPVYQSSAKLLKSESADDSPSSLDSQQEPVILDGVLYTSVEGIGPTKSIGSSAFELIHATEFEEMEAEHSQRGSPTSEYEDAMIKNCEDNDSDNAEQFMDAASQKSHNYEDFVLNNISENENRGSHAEHITNGFETEQNIEDFTEEEYLSTIDGDDNESKNYKNDLEILSHQLTLSQGIEDFMGKIKSAVVSNACMTRDRLRLT